MTHLEERARELMRSDPLGDVEKLTGMRYDQPEVAVLGMMFVHELAEKKRAVLGELRDTYHRMSWQSFLAVVQELGFVIVLERQFPYKDVMPTQLIAAHPSKYLVLTASSYVLSDGEVVNDAVVHGECAASDKDSMRSLQGTSNGPVVMGENPRWFSLDAREGLRLKLAQLRELTPWSGVQHYIGVDDYSVAKILPREEVDARQIAVFRTLPQWVQDFAGVARWRC